MIASCDHHARCSGRVEGYHCASFCVPVSGSGCGCGSCCGSCCAPFGHSIGLYCSVHSSGSACWAACALARRQVREYNTAAFGNARHASPRATASCRIRERASTPFSLRTAAAIRLTFFCLRARAPLSQRALAITSDRTLVLFAKYCGAQGSARC